MVSSFTQLLRCRYEGQLDETAEEFIGYAVDGATRLQTLINALLEYSRVRTRGKPFAAVEEGGAEIHSSGPSSMPGDEVQPMQLFQNLIANALKFRGDGRPLVRVEARR